MSNFSLIDTVKDGVYAGKFVGFDTLTKTFKITSVKTVFENHAEEKITFTETKIEEEFKFIEKNTATEKVQEDIIKNLKIYGANTFKASFNRPNLYYEVRTKDDNVEKDIIKYIKNNIGKSGKTIVKLLKNNKVPLSCTAKVCPSIIPHMA